MAQVEYRTHVALTFNQAGQTLEFYPPIEELVLDGVMAQTGGTFAIFRGMQSNDDTPILTGNLTHDNATVTLSTTGDAGPQQSNREKIPLESTTGLVIGRRYLLQNLTGAGREFMIVIPKTILTDLYMLHEHAIPVTFSTGAGLKGIRYSFTIDPTFIANAANINLTGGLSDRTIPFGSGETDTTFPPYRVRWTYTTATGGLARNHWTTFDVRRAPLQHNVSVDSVKRLVPDVIWNEWLQQRGMDFQPQIAEAFERVRFDIRMAGYDPNMITDPEIVDRLTKLAAVSLIMRALEHDTSGAYETDYRNSFEKAIGTGLRAWMQTDASGAITPSPAKQLWLER